MKKLELKHLDGLKLRSIVAQQQNTTTKFSKLLYVINVIEYDLIHTYYEVAYEGQTIKSDIVDLEEAIKIYNDI